MTIAEFQEWTKRQDMDSKWINLTTLQLVAHLVEEIGEITRSINRTYEYRGLVKKEHTENLRMELIDSMWFLFKIANKYKIDLETEMAAFRERATEWPSSKHADKLVNGLSVLDEEIRSAKNEIELE